tara:strand:+ start:8058 stop:8315 length:258 start_codon:yes stop_codon:yes gene_type:complete
VIENYFIGEEGNLITVFTHPECEYSKMLIDDLVQSGEIFQNIDLLVDPEFWNSVENVCKGNRMTPITIYEDGSHLVGYNGVASKF